MKNRLFFHTLILVAIFLLFFIPVILYTFKFGVGLWETHDDWSLMGSALGGIYGPITSITTCVILFVQIKAQREDKHNQKGMIAFLEMKAILTLSLNEIYNILSSQDQDVQNFFERIGRIATDDMTASEIMKSLKDVGLSSAQSVRVITEWDKVLQLKYLIDIMNFEMANFYISTIQFEIDAKFPCDVQKKLSEFVHITKRHIGEMESLDPAGQISEA
ncbi:hypothetical protein [Aeromonas rivipollensis]|uniref:hypothetical protein n=1 Tax=Aeromonas rivipollensis TaxID=948519 RepID=UPI00259FAEE6|nr:hypothetical protein [Aeromonas rivipollensis]MDM5125111.1 hypothetical protein [Aeromonas rivipollensis]